MDNNKTISEFAFNCGLILGTAHKILENNEYFEYFIERGVDAESFEKLTESIKEISKAFYAEV